MCIKRGFMVGLGNNGFTNPIISSCLEISSAYNPFSSRFPFPAQLLFGRQLRSQLDLLLPSIADKVQRNQNLQKQTHDYHARDRQLQLDDLVLAKNHGQGPPWIPGKILIQSGAVTFMVELTNGTVIRRHIDQLKLNMTNPVEI